ncbi:MAG: hypothetical protein UC961_09580 [Emergencia sp.]|nr:hypothetical protein [Emergencia sp.]
MPYLANLSYAEEPSKLYLQDLFNSVQLKDIMKRHQLPQYPGFSSNENLELICGRDNYDADQYFGLQFNGAERTGIFISGRSAYLKRPAIAPAFWYNKNRRKRSFMIWRKPYGLFTDE